MMYRVLIVSCLFITAQMMSIEIASPAKEGWHKSIVQINDSTSITGSDLIDLDTYEFIPADIAQEAKQCLILVFPDLSNQTDGKRLKKDSRIFAETFAKNESCKTSFIEFEIEDTVDIAKLREQGLKTATLIKSLKEEYKIIIVGMGVGGCIAKSVVHNLKYSTKNIALLVLISTPVIESSYTDFTIVNTQTVLNLYSTSDEMQLSSVVFTTLRKINALQSDVKVFNMRLHIDGNEPNKEAIYLSMRRLALIVQNLAAYTIHRDLDVNCCMSNEAIHLVIRTEKSYRELSNPKEACVEINSSNEHAENFKKLYGKEIGEKSSIVILVVSNVLKIGLGYLNLGK